MTNYRIAISGENSGAQVWDMIKFMGCFMDVEMVSTDQEIVDQKTGETVYTVHVIDAKATGENFLLFEKQLKDYGHELTKIGDTYFM